MTRVQTQIEFNENNTLATISFGQHKVGVYPVSEQNGGGFRMQINGREIKDYSFQNKQDFLNRVGSILNHEIGTAGTARPNLRSEFLEIYKKLNLQPGTPNFQTQNQTNRTVTVEYNSTTNPTEATIRIGDEAFFIKKENPGGFSYSKEDAIELYSEPITNKTDFLVFWGGILDREIGTIQSGARERVPQFGEIFDKLNLQRGTPILTNTFSRTDGENVITGDRGDGLTHALPQRTDQIQKDILDLPIGKYTKDDNPEIYLLVRNANKSAYYCLSAVQNLFDYRYGHGSAREAGLFSAQYAQDLDFSNTDSKGENFNPSKEYPVGTIVRMGSGGAITHVGMVVRPGVVAHIIGPKFYVDKLPTSRDGRLSEGWRINEMVVPSDSILSREQPTTIERTFNRVKNNSLEVLSGEIIKLPFFRGRRTDLANVQEIIYQLNKDKFEIQYNGRRKEYVAICRTDELKIPKEWTQSR